MKARDQGEMIREGSDYFIASASKRKHRGHIVIDERFDEDEVDEDYKVFLGKVGVLRVAGKGKKVKGSKRLIDPDEEIREDWLTREKPLNAGESDEEIQEDWWVAEKVLNAAGSDVPAEEVGPRKGVDADKGETGSDEEEDDCDPDYMMFYRGLKPCGTAYVIELARGNGIEIIKYEDKDEDEFPSSDERKRKASNPVGRPRRDRRSNNSQREMKNQEIGCGKLKRHGNLPQPPSDERKRKVSNPVGRPPIARRSNGLHKEMENLEIGRGQLKRHGNLPQQSRKGERNKELERVQIPQHDKIDESYDVCLRGLKRHGNSPQQCSKGERDEESERVQIPQHDEIDKHYCMFLRSLKISGDSFVYEDKDGGIQYRYNELTDESASDSDSEGSPTPPPSSNKRLASSGKRVPSNQSVERSSSEFKKMTPEPSNKMLAPSGKGGPSNPSVERSSTEFSLMTPEPSNKRLPPSGKRVPSNPNVERSSSEFKHMTPDPSNKRLASSVKRVPSNQIVERPSSEFRQGVTDILLKPYSKKELDDLLKAAVLRKPQVHFHETRSRSVGYYDDRTKGKSFLDYHIDLKKKIKPVLHDDPPKALQLLRGLFFYLTHACMEDQFKPWNDDKWLEAMNRSTSQRHH